MNGNKEKFKQAREHKAPLRPIILTKLTDDVFNGNHPNGIHEGYVVKGHEILPPKIGERYIVVCSRGFSTSIVTKVLDNNGIFKTTYSTYQIKYLDNESLGNK
jgi:rhodanese-related sulfurtransferase